jgi:hypothetical protein
LEVVEVVNIIVLGVPISEAEEAVALVGRIISQLSQAIHILYMLEQEEVP